MTGNYTLDIVEPPSNGKQKKILERGEVVEGLLEPVLTHAKQHPNLLMLLHTERKETEIKVGSR